MNETFALMKKLDNFISTCSEYYQYNSDELTEEEFDAMLDDENFEIPDLSMSMEDLIADKFHNGILVGMSKLTGVKSEDIPNCDQDIVLSWYNKFKFFKLYNLYENAAYGKFNPNATPETRQLAKEVYKRTHIYLKKLNELAEGVYHENAKMTKFRFGSYCLLSFPKTSELVESFLELVDRAKTLFFKAFDNELTKEEIMEYNFLATTLRLTDVKAEKIVFYDNLKKLIPIYKNQIYDKDYENFFECVQIKLKREFHPWICKEFTIDVNLVQKFVYVLPKTKHYMFEYGRRIKNYACHYRWSDDDENKNVHSDLIKKNSDGDNLIYIPKTPAELGDNAVYADRLIKLGGSVSNGGIRKPARTKIICLDDDLFDDKKERISAFN